MAIIKAFKAIRPAPDKVHLVASRSVDAYSKQELAIKLMTNPYSFVHIIKPEYNIENKGQLSYSNLLQKIKQAYSSYINDDIFIQDEKAGIYIYQQIGEKGVFTGFMACAAADDYTNNVIKLHEQTLSEKEEKLKQYLEVCDFNAEPVCFGHDNNDELELLLNKTFDRKGRVIKEGEFKKGILMEGKEYSYEGDKLVKTTIRKGGSVVNTILEKDSNK